MKSGFAFSLLFAFCCCSCSKTVKEKDIPIAAKATFTSLYPKANNVKWTKEDGKFEAEFEQTGADISILIDANGTLVQTETEIATSTLPQAIRDYVSKNLNGKSIKEAAKIAAADGKLSYEAEVGGVDYLFDANGNFLETETADSDDKDDKD
jgi:hypothetical protein